jgi:hypothetical protein
LGHDIPADFGEGRAEDDPHISGEPPEAGHELIDFADVEPLDDSIMIEEIKYMRLGVLDVCDRAKSEVLIE